MPPRRADLIPARWDGVRGPFGVAGVVALAATALYLRDPHQQGSWGVCPTRLLTGADCPGCGGLRAVNDLTHLRFVDAASSNALFVAALPVVALGWLWWLQRRRHDPQARALPPVPQRLQPWLWTAGLTLIVAFTVVRNLPGSWFAA